MGISLPLKKDRGTPDLLRSPHERRPSASKINHILVATKLDESEKAAVEFSGQVRLIQFTGVDPLD